MYIVNNIQLIKFSRQLSGLSLAYFVMFLLICFR